MKAPLSWLKEYVDIDCTPEELKDKLFSCGFEVEDMTYIARHIERIVTCRILSIEKHPDADKLSVTKVDAGKYGELQIITAATNIFVGAVVPVALDNSTLANGEHIKNGKLRGLPSNGMFCSGEELGITDDWYDGASVNGILIFKENYEPGLEVKEILGLEDVMFDINVTANRPDCQSILGLAREIAAVLGKTVKMPDLTFKVDKNISTKKVATVQNEAFDLCPRYISHYVSDVKIEDSPVWLKRRLFRMGLRSINNFVDITNFVLLEIGQPMHAFDINDIFGNKIIVRRAKENEKIVTLDNKEFVLAPEHLVICDGERPVALAGIMGGLNSEIKQSTENILFESAKFARDNIRKTSKAVGQRTDASSRYEKGVDLYSVEIGMKRALNLVDKLGAGKIACDEYDLCSEKLEKKVIITTVSKVNGVLGISVQKEEIKRILECLCFEAEISGDNLKVKVPLYREDMENYQDIAEEIIREYGYSHIVPTLLKSSSITAGGRTPEQTRIEAIKKLLAGYGFNEMLSYSFVSEKENDTFDSYNGIPKEKIVRLLNPLGENLSIMRTSLVPSAVRAACYNLNRKNFEGRLFEFAKIYSLCGEDGGEFASEENVLSFTLFGENEDFFTAKGIVEGLFDALLDRINIEYKPCAGKGMHPTRSAEIFINGESVGYFGQVNPVISAKFDVDKPIYAGELFYEKIKKHFSSKITAKAISKYPTVERDLAIILDESVPCAEVMNAIKSSAGRFLESVSLFDVYQGDQIENGKKSMAFNLIFVSYDRTLTVEEIDETIAKVLKNLRDKLNAQLR